MDTYLATPTSGGWLRFAAPVQIITAPTLADVLPALDEITRRVERDGLHAVGFISYEAAPAFDAALHAHPPDAFPLLWFGLYPPPHTLVEPVETPVKTHKPGFNRLNPRSEFHLNAWQPSVSRAAYAQAIGHIKTAIARGDTYQVNYTLRLRANFTGQPWHLFQTMMQAQPTPYAAYIDTGRFVLCSASPELFFQLDGETITCRPMKGTAARGPTSAADEAQAAWLHASEKNRAENVMIVDMIRNDLGRIARTGSVQTTRLFAVERYPTLWQMTSTVTAQTAASLPQIFAALFPCASITGAPKVATTGIIARLENTPRRAYTGVIGHIAPGRQARFSVAIRTAIVDRAAAQVELGVGSGIVWDSTQTDEYEECLMKARFLTEASPAFSLLESLLWTPGEGYFLLDDHLRRLAASAHYFAFPLDITQAAAKLDELAASLPGAPHKIRLLLHRDGSFDGQALPLAALHKPDPALVRLAASPVNSADRFLYHKTTQRKVYEAALADCPGCDEVLLWNERGELTEATTANIVLELDGRLLTPPVSSGLLAGTFRAALLAQAEIVAQVLPVAALARCTNLYLINSVRKWRKAQLAG
jgi:para-aminobenzoate synthetase/4-amino-4-deoxychorismate lyase